MLVFNGGYMKKTLIISLSMLSSIAMVNPAQAMHTKKEAPQEACSKTRSYFRKAREEFNDASRDAKEAFANPTSDDGRIPENIRLQLIESVNLFDYALRRHLDCINTSTRNFHKSNAPKIKRVEKTCNPLLTLFLNAKDADAEAALRKYEACLKQELAKLYEQKKQNK